MTNHLNSTLTDAHLSHDRICDCLQINGAFVGEVVKDIGGANSLRSSLLVPKHQIHPLVQLA